MKPEHGNVPGTKTTGLTPESEYSHTSEKMPNATMALSSELSRGSNPPPKRSATPPGHKLVYPVNPTPIQLIAKPKTVVNHSYRDFSRISPDSQDEIPHELADMSFAQKVHEILSTKAYQGYISWMPHGRAFRILVPKRFEMKVTPIYFGHARFSTFLRQLNNHGFKHITQGADRNCYYHEAFLRGLPHLCKYMPRGKNRRRISADPKNEPNFYHISDTYPVPEGELRDTTRGPEKAVSNEEKPSSKQDAKRPAAPSGEHRGDAPQRNRSQPDPETKEEENAADAEQETRIECAEAVALAQQQALASATAAVIARQRQAAAAAALAQQQQTAAAAAALAQQRQTNASVVALARERFLLGQQLAIPGLGCPTSAQATTPLHTSHLQGMGGSSSTLIAALAAQLGSTERVLGVQNAARLGLASSIFGRLPSSSNSAGAHFGYNIHQR